MGLKLSKKLGPIKTFPSDGPHSGGPHSDVHTRHAPSSSIGNHSCVCGAPIETVALGQVMEMGIERSRWDLPMCRISSLLLRHAYIHTYIHRCMYVCFVYNTDFVLSLIIRQHVKQVLQHTTHNISLFFFFLSHQ